MTSRNTNMAHPNRHESMQQSPSTQYEGDDRKSLQATVSQPGYNHTMSYTQQQQQFPQTRTEDSFNLNPLGNALPDVTYESYSHLPAQEYGPSHTPNGFGYQLPNTPQYSNAQGLNVPTNSSYSIPYQGQSQGVYATGHTPTHLQTLAAPTNQFYPNQGFLLQQQQQQQQRQHPYFIQQNQYMPQVYPTYSSQYGPRSFSTGDPRLHLPRPANLGIKQMSGSEGRSSSIGSGASQSSVVRGPPRKPRQSGHAIWIGNLPPQTDLMKLVLHVCKETPGLESLFLISKSNCAFANFKNEELCVTAQTKIHDSRFQTVRLVSRLRRTSTGTPTSAVIPTGPAALVPMNVSSSESGSHEPGTDTTSTAIDEGADQNPLEREGKSISKDKFFVVKSLTVEDLELSVRNGIWATQSHNEESLNQAYKSADNVYLIFSANKSGEYFGYAKMVSPINDDPAAAIEFAPKAQFVEDPELPKATSTLATEFAPKGRIIDDSARGTIFWEAERDEEEEEEESGSNKSEQGESTPTKAWGRPFKIEWLSTTRLPFYRTRGLRNPWNSNREVKIARDGTELETSIGRRLIGLFHRVPSPTTQPPHLQGAAMSLHRYTPVVPYP